MDMVKALMVFTQIGVTIIEKTTKEYYDDSEDEYHGLSDDEIAEEEMKKFYKRLAN